MPIVFPDLKSAKCIFFMACGQIETTDTASLKWIKKQPAWMVARRKTPGGTIYVRAGFGGKSGRHCHVDIAAADYFGSEGGPKTTHKAKEILGILEELKGKKIALDLEGTFRLNKGALPPIIQATMVGASEDGVAIEMTAGRFSVRGAPITSVTWAIGRSEDDKAVLTLDAAKETTITDSYLVDSFQVIASGFDVFVSGGVPHG